MKLHKITRAATSFAAAALVTGMTVLATPSASAVSWPEIQYCTLGFVDCAYAKDAGNWAESVTAWRYGAMDESFHGGTPDAYRHCVLGGALTQRIGEDRAMTLLAVHELDAPDGDDHIQMDLENDRIGVEIGGRAAAQGGSDTWGWIMDQCGKKADSGQLTTLQ